MAHNLDTSTGKPAIAFRGDRKDIWHRFGDQHQYGWTIHDWQKHAGLDWTAIKVPALADMSALDMLGGPLGHCQVDGDRYVVRSDNGHVLGHCSDRYQPVQPCEVLDWFEKYCSVDGRFQLDVAGALKKGEIIWATATYNGDLIVAGDKHVPRLLMTTTFDGTGSTINRATMTRVVCNNTLDCALADKQKSIVRTRHSTKFDAARVGSELATIAKGFDAYKAMGEAMAGHHMATQDISRFFKACLDIPFDAKQTDISTRKLNQYQEINQSYGATVRDGAERNTAWSAFNAFTRYIDHERSTRGDGEAAERRFTSSVVDMAGSGTALKGRAVAVLEGMGVSWTKPDDVAGILAQPLRTSFDR